MCREFCASVFSQLSRTRNEEGERGWDTGRWGWGTKFITLIEESAKVHRRRSESEHLQLQASIEKDIEASQWL